MISFLKQFQSEEKRREEEERYRDSHPGYQCGVGDIGFTSLEPGGAYANTYVSCVVRVDAIDDEEVTPPGFVPWVKSKYCKCTVLAVKYSEGYYDGRREPSEDNFFLKWGVPKKEIQILKPLSFIEKCHMPKIGSDESFWDLGVKRSGD